MKPYQSTMTYVLIYHVAPNGGKTVLMRSEKVFYSLIDAHFVGDSMMRKRTDIVKVDVTRTNKLKPVVSIERNQL